MIDSDRVKRLSVNNLVSITNLERRVEDLEKKFGEGMVNGVAAGDLTVDCVDLFDYPFGKMLRIASDKNMLIKITRDKKDASVRVFVNNKLMAAIGGLDELTRYSQFDNVIIEAVK